MGVWAKVGAIAVGTLTVACLGMAIWNTVHGIKSTISGEDLAASRDAWTAIGCMFGALSGTYATTRIIEEDL